jgi:hypothetical protein
MGSGIINFKKVIAVLCASVSLWFICGDVCAQPSRLVFLPETPTFERLIGDPREMQTSVLFQLSRSRYDGSIGTTFEFLQWQAGDDIRWGWGIEADSFINLDQQDPNDLPVTYSLSVYDIFPNRVSDWYLGTYIAQSAGSFSNRLEYLHVSSHLGDKLFTSIERFVYTRESFRLTSSFKPSECFHPHIAPEENRFFLHAGCEIYTGTFPFIAATTARFYFTYDIKVKDEAGGALNQNFGLGLQWKWKKESRQALRLAVIYYSGNSEYGQFYRGNDNHWGLGIFCDP